MSPSQVARLGQCRTRDHVHALIGETLDAPLDVGLATFSSQRIEVLVFWGHSVLEPGTRTGRIECVRRLLCPLAASLQAQHQQSSQRVSSPHTAEISGSAAAKPANRTPSDHDERVSRRNPRTLEPA